MPLDLRHATPLAPDVGPYRPMALLGSGGMGVVYRAVHVKTGQWVALKVLLGSHSGRALALRREIRALTQLAHPGLARIVAHGADFERPWLAMQLVEGDTLWPYLDGLAEQLAPSGTRSNQNTGPLPPPLWPTVLRIFHRLCESLAYVHGEGLVHRDLKPGNIIMGADGWPVIVDFGITSQFAGDTSRERLDLGTETGGTAQYMAPEQIRGELVDARADLYALGCVLFEVLSGRPPFMGDTEEVAQRHMRETPPPLNRLVPGLPPPVVQLVAQLLAKDPNRRLGHASRVAAALREMGAPTQGAPPGPPARPYLNRPSFTGRDDEMGTLLQHVSGLAGGAGKLVMLSGESGVGKTRVCLELAQQAVIDGALVLAGDCQPVGLEAGPDQTGHAPPLGPLVRPLQAILDYCRHRGPEMTAEIMGDGSHLVAAFVPEIERLPGLGHADGRLLLPHDSARFCLFTELAGILGRLSTKTPVVLFTDDIQWADELTMSLLAHCVAQGVFAKNRILWVATYRSEESSAELRELSTAAGVLHVPLDRLEAKAVREVIGDMLGLEDPPWPLARFIYGQSEGNPFFVAEYLRSALDLGLLRMRPDGAWTLAEHLLPAFERVPERLLSLPKTLRSLVGRRLDGLSPASRALAEVVAVLGRETYESLSCAASGLSDDAHCDALAELVQREVIEPMGQGRLRFAHDKLREVTYQATPAPRRMALHAAAAKALSAAYAQVMETMPAVLGYHHERAGDFEKAAPAYLAAARQAVSQHALSEAGRFYTHYLELLGRSGRKDPVARNELVTEVLMVLGRTEEGIAAHQLALVEAHDIGDQRSEGRALIGLARLLHRSGQIQSGREHAESALTLFRAVSDKAAEARVLVFIASQDLDRGRPFQIEEKLQQALGLFKEAGDRSGTAIALHRIGLARHYAGEELSKAREYVAQAVAIHQELGERRLEGETLSNLAYLSREMLRLDEAEQLYGQALAIHRHIGNQTFVGNTLLNLGAIAMARSLWTAAHQLLVEGLGVLDQAKDRRLGAYGRLQLAIWHRLSGGDLGAAKAFLDRAQTDLEGAGNWPRYALVLCERGQWLLAMGQSGRPPFEAALALVSRMSPKSENELTRALKRLDKTLRAYEAGVKLVRGELPEGHNPVVAKPKR